MARGSPFAWLTSRMGASTRALGASDIFVGFTCLYLLTAGRSPPFGDARPMWEAAESLARHGSLAIELRWPVNAPAGVGGHYYPVAALLAVLVHVPGALLQRLLAAVAPERAPQFIAITSQLAPVLVGAAIPALFFRLLGRLGHGLRQAALGALMLGTGTALWVYAHRPYSEILQAACFLMFLDALIGVGERPGRGTAVWFGVTAALLINTKNVYFTCLPGAAAYLFWRLRVQHGSRRGVVLGAVVGFLPGVVALGLYNHLRWGSIFDSGYGRVTVGFWGENILTGLWGQFLSPGKSVFLYSPPLLAALAGVGRFWRRRRSVAIAVVATVGPVVLLYCRYLFWSGDWAWGPRYLVFALPALLLPVVELFGPTEDAGASVPSSAAGGVRRAGRFAVATLWAAGVMVQLLGNAFYWDDFINVSRQAQHAWLGRPDVSGTPLAPAPCFSCFEEVYPVQWLPSMQPIGGHWWLLRHKLAGDDWQVAEADAGWKRYTSRTLNIAESYRGAEIDWWPLGAAGSGGLAVALIAGLLLLAIPLRPWLAALRTRTGEESAQPRREQ